MQFPFIGGSYQNQSLRADAQSTINLYPATDSSGAGKSKMQLVGRPGLSLFVTLSPSGSTGNPGIRGIWIGSNRLFAVAGSRLCEVFQNGTYTNRGDVGNDGLPVQVFPNGNQIAIVSAGNVWVDSGQGPSQPTFPLASGTVFTAGTGSTQVYWQSGQQFDFTWQYKTITIGATNYTVNQVSSPFVLFVNNPINVNGYQNYSIPSGPIPAISGTFLDGYAIVTPPNSAQINISKLYDFSTWDPLDYAIKEGYPDYINAVIADHTNLYLLGRQTAEIWRNTGNPDFPFERIPGEVLQIGCVATNSPDKIAGGIAFLGTDSRGGPVAFLLVGYQWQKISTPPLEAIWAKYSTVTDAVSFTYVDGGHAFWEISFPTANATWVWDAVENLWHQRAWNGTTNRTRGYLHGYVWGNHYVGDWQNGNIYYMSRDYYDDNLTAITRQRTAAHLANEAKQIIFKDFTLDIQPGEIASPQFTLAWSRDGGNNYLASRTLTGGAAGDYLTRFIWRRLGAAGRGRVRTFQMTSTAKMRHVWIDSYINATGGSD